MIIFKKIHQIRNERKYKYKKTITQKESCIQFINEETKFNQVNWLPYSRKEKWIATDPMSGE